MLIRLKEGKVYVPQQAEWATQNFFQMGNLIALRELALRITTDRVNAQVLVYRLGQAVQTTWPTTERLLVCVGPSPSSAKLIRATKRMAASLQAKWFAIYVEDPKMLRLPEADRNRVVKTCSWRSNWGEDLHPERPRHSRRDRQFCPPAEHHEIVVGKPCARAGRDILFGSP